MIDYIKGCGFDGAVIFTTFSQSPLPAALMMFLADIPLRLAHCRENPYYLLTHWVKETDNFGQPDIRHEVRRQLDLVETVGAHTLNENLSLHISFEAIEKVRGFLLTSGLNIHTPWLIIHPGATAASRRYPMESFADVAKNLTSLGFQILFTGTEPERELVESIRSKMNAASFSLVGRLSIQQFAALIRLAPLLISNNTGPVHIAAALNTPVVDLYALTNPQHTPWSVANRVLYYDVPCKFCYKSICPMEHHNCLRLVSPNTVVEATLDLLREVETGSPKDERRQLAKT
jgi:lipopolysaccharide heptosyltransferase II